MISTALLQS